MSQAPFSGIRVVELGSLPAAAYAARLLADFGAEVIKFEPPEGDPGRRAAPSIQGDLGAFFAFANFGKQSVVGDPRQLIESADVVISSDGIDRTWISDDTIVADVSWFGRTGPYANFAGSDVVCRALAGLVHLTGPAEGPPLALPDFQAAIVGGLQGFIAVTASLLARLHGQGSRRIEVSVLESCIALSEYQGAEAFAVGKSQRRIGINRYEPTYPVGIYPCREGWLGITIVTPAQWTTFCQLTGMEDLIGNPAYLMGIDRLPKADELEDRFCPVLRQKSAAEWFEIGLEHRLPFAVMPDMAGVLTTPSFRQRQAIVPLEYAGRRFESVGSPLNLTSTPPRRGGRVPELGTGQAAWSGPAVLPKPETSAAGLPLAGIRIIDLSMGWAGPCCTRHMADLGADVIKVEACQYPDWWRGVDNRPAVVEQLLYEKTPRFNIMNRNKRDITLDLTDPRGAALLKRLVAGADAVVENYSAEVLPKLGLDYPRLREVNPCIVMVSMAAFGHASPWRDCRAYGSTLEHGSGLPSVAGYDGGPPVLNHLAYGDAVGGLNAASALLAALIHRKRTGVGQHIDLAQVECMLPFAAPWAIAQSANGNIGPRRGIRHPDFVPQGCFRCAGDDNWICVSVTSEAAWRAVCQLVGRADLVGADRRAVETEIEQALADWSRSRSADEAMNMLQGAGIAAGVVRSPFATFADPHLRARGFWQACERTHIGAHLQPSTGYRQGRTPYPVRSPAPTLGEHNEEVLGGLLGLSKDEIEALERDGVIGRRAVPPSQRKARAAMA